MNVAKRIFNCGTREKAAGAMAAEANETVAKMAVQAFAVLLSAVHRAPTWSWKLRFVANPGRVPSPPPGRTASSNGTPSFAKVCLHHLDRCRPADPATAEMPIALRIWASPAFYGPAAPDTAEMPMAPQVGASPLRKE
jgi:hypothetical protein